MPTEDEIKRAMLEKRMQEQLSGQAAQQAELEKNIKTILMKILDDKARERLSNLKLVKPDIATQLEIYLIQLFQAGHIRRITDSQLVEILKKMNEQHVTKIHRK